MTGFTGPIVASQNSLRSDLSKAHDSDLPTERIGRYELVRRMASGGMGELYLAHDPDVDRSIVIKLLLDRIDSPQARQRFAIEGRAAGRLRHKNIVTVFDVGEWQSRSWIAMEFITGETLAQKIERRSAVAARVKAALYRGALFGSRLRPSQRCDPP